MPLTPKGEKIKGAMEKQYGAKKGKSVFYASANKGTIKGVHAMSQRPLSDADTDAIADEIMGKKKCS